MRPPKTPPPPPPPFTAATSRSASSALSHKWSPHADVSCRRRLDREANETEIVEFDEEREEEEVIYALQRCSSSSDDASESATIQFVTDDRFDHRLHDRETVDRSTWRRRGRLVRHNDAEREQAAATAAPPPSSRAPTTASSTSILSPRPSTSTKTFEKRIIEEECETRRHDNIDRLRAAIVNGSTTASGRHADEGASEDDWNNNNRLKVCNRFARLDDAA